MNQKTVARFWEKVDKSAASGCWTWKASKRNKGYGAFVWAGDDGEIVQGRAHRFSWLLHCGPIAEQQCVLHRCDNPACVNPDHLFVGSKADNNQDMRNKGRNVAGGTYGKEGYRRGESHPNVKLTDADVENLRSDRAAGMAYSKLAAKYKIAIGHAWRLCNNVAR